jgi:hypothetical protein
VSVEETGVLAALVIDELNAGNEGKRARSSREDGYDFYRGKGYDDDLLF